MTEKETEENDMPLNRLFQCISQVRREREKYKNQMVVMSVTTAY